jgi:hypothetical protein
MQMLFTQPPTLGLGGNTMAKKYKDTIRIDGVEHSLQAMIGNPYLLKRYINRQRGVLSLLGGFLRMSECCLAVYPGSVGSETAAEFEERQTKHKKHLEGLNESIVQRKEFIANLEAKFQEICPDGVIDVATEKQKIADIKKQMLESFIASVDATALKQFCKDGGTLSLGGITVSSSKIAAIQRSKNRAEVAAKKAASADFKKMKAALPSRPEPKWTASGNYDPNAAAAGA